MKRFTLSLMALVMALLAGQNINAHTGVTYTPAASEFTVETNADAQQVKLRIYKEGIGEVVRYEVVPHDQLEGVEVLMDKDARSVGMPLATLSPEVKRQLAKWGIQ